MKNRHTPKGQEISECLYIIFQFLERDGNPDVGCNTGPPQDMNTYLQKMVRCLASVARPR